ncbi:MAG: hypothetical protein HZT40_09590 [Candidatus Thiothrix singaporensis]|uniref:Uncharacterized protein n=1 Tax=Candidatus Thiothrix singaporensis TaxID=2799669 RepID=A0A7L6AMK4_9GAMM|nr:MAG: hypothetical protein HZT40_09590 [Candidatus Thiothrix singaporensis]
MMLLEEGQQDDSIHVITSGELEVVKLTGVVIGWCCKCCVPARWRVNLVLLTVLSTAPPFAP